MTGGFAAVLLWAGLGTAWCVWLFSSMSDQLAGQNVPSLIGQYVLIFYGPLVLYLIVQRRGRDRAAEEKRRASEAEDLEFRRQEAAERQRHQEEQSQVLARLSSLRSEAVNFWGSLRPSLESTGVCLESAEQHFVDRAYAPFWDAVERTAVHLGAIDDSIAAIRRHAHAYRQLLPQLEGSPEPGFLASEQPDGLQDETRQATLRLESLVHRAQRDFEFATIYEQRRTNQLLVAGFSGLGNILNGLGTQLNQSFDELGSTMRSMTTTVDGSLQAIGAQLSEQRADQQRVASQTAARDARTARVLKDIERNTES